MRIALIGHQYPPRITGGIGSLYADLAEGLRALGHDVWVLIPDERLGREGQRVIRDREAGVTWLPLRAPRMVGWRGGQYWRRAMILRELRKEHERQAIDLVEVTDCLGWLPWGGLRGVPLVVRLHGATFFFDPELGRQTGSSVDHQLERLTCARGSCLVGVSQYALERTLHHGGPLLERFRRRPELCRVIHNAVDTERFCPDPAIPVEPGLIVFANTLEYRKGIFELCEAFNTVAEQFPHARLVCIGKQTGKSRDGSRPIVEELRELVREPFRARLEFTGPLDRFGPGGLLDWLRRAAVCVFPSHLETFGLAPVEAMAVGRPTIYSRLGPGPELIRDGEEGLLRDPAQPGELAGALTQLLRDPAAAEAMGQRARTMVRARFDKADWLRANLRFYEELC